MKIFEENCAISSRCLFRLHNIGPYGLVIVIIAERRWKIDGDKVDRERMKVKGISLLFLFKFQIFEWYVFVVK